MNVFIALVNRILEMDTAYYKSDNFITKVVARIGLVFRYLGPALIMATFILTVVEKLIWSYFLYSIVFALVGRIFIYEIWKSLRKKRLKKPKDKKRRE